MTLTYGSVCSGIEAATVAWHGLGWKPAFFSEIERFPSAVLAHHYKSNMPGDPLATDGVPNHGDFTKIGTSEGHAAGPNGLLVGGTPCQSFSVAGKRLGLDDPRGNLALEFLALARRLRAKWIVWENVPGVLSSRSDDGTHDFATFLDFVRQCGYGFAYRVLDAQYVRTCEFPWAVPQRRRRVFVVGYLGDWRRAASVLLEPEGLRGDPAPRRESGQGIAPTISARPTGGGGLGTDFDLDGGLIAADVAGTIPAGGNNTGGHRPPGMGQETADSMLVAYSFKDYGNDAETETLVAHSLRGEGFDASEDGTERGTPLVSVERPVLKCGKCDEVFVDEYGSDIGGLSPYECPACGEENDLSEVDTDTGPVAFSFKDSGNDAAIGVSPTLRSLGGYDANGGAQMAVAFQERGRKSGRSLEYQEDVAYALTAPSGGGRAQERNIATPWAVRRLTPTECERLQGFPDGWTDIPWRGKDHAPDGPRYKALGNSFAVNVIQWIGIRIQMVDEIAKEIDREDVG